MGESIEVMYRYAVVETWGVVPPQIAAMLDDPETVLLYKEDRGEESQQDFYRHGEGVIGGWVMERRGECLIDPKRSVVTVDD